MDGHGGVFRVRRYEEISNCRENGQEVLQCAWRRKSLHGPLSFSQRQMRVLGAIVQAPIRSMLDSRHDLASCRSIGAKLVCDDAFRQASLLLHQPDQETLGSLGIAPTLDELVENVAVPINRPPQPVFPPANRHHHFVQMRRIAGPWRFPPQTASIIRAELLRPAPDRLVRNDDAALQQHLFHQTQAQRKSNVQPDRK